MNAGKNRLFAGIAFLAGLLLLAGCSPASDPGKEERELLPYSLYGQAGDWEVSCVVRAMTEAEKQEELADLKEQQELLEKELEEETIDEATRRQLIEQYQRTAQNLQEKTAYISSVTGVCRDEGTAGTSFQWRLASAEGTKIAEGTQTASTEPGLWYSSYQMDGPLFIPPLDQGKLVITAGEEIVTIPLTFEAYTQKQISG